MKNRRMCSLALLSLVALPGFAATKTTTSYTEISTEKPNIVYVTDHSIRETYDKLIDSTPNLDDDVGFSVRDGVITLRGTVDSEFESEAAEKMAYKIEGVQHVVNKLVAEEASLKAMNKAYEYQKTTTRTYRESTN